VGQIRDEKPVADSQIINGWFNGFNQSDHKGLKTHLIKLHYSDPTVVLGLSMSFVCSFPDALLRFHFSRIGGKVGPPVFYCVAVVEKQQPTRRISAKFIIFWGVDICILFIYIHTWLVVWNFGTYFIVPYIGNNHPNWVIFFRGVETTNQIHIIYSLKKPAFLQMFPETNPTLDLTALTQIGYSGASNHLSVTSP